MDDVSSLLALTDDILTLIPCASRKEILLRSPLLSFAFVHGRKSSRWWLPSKRYYCSMIRYVRYECHEFYQSYKWYLPSYRKHEMIIRRHYWAPIPQGHKLNNDLSKLNERIAPQINTLEWTSCSKTGQFWVVSFKCWSISLYHPNVECNIKFPISFADPWYYAAQSAQKIKPSNLHIWNLIHEFTSL